MKNIGKPSPKWDKVEFSKFEPDAITIYVNYKAMPNNMLEVRTDTNKIANAVLDAVRSKGYDPQKNWFALHVHAQKREDGGMTRRFGKVDYDFNTNQIEFTDAKDMY